MNLVILSIVAAGAALVLAIYKLDVLASVLRDLTQPSTKEKAEQRARELVRRHGQTTRQGDLDAESTEPE